MTSTEVKEQEPIDRLSASMLEMSNLISSVTVVKNTELQTRPSIKAALANTISYIASLSTLSKNIITEIDVPDDRILVLCEEMEKAVQNLREQLL